MKNVMTNGFCELNEQEMMMTDGGWNPVTALTNFLKETDPFKLYETQASEDAATAHAAYEQWVCENSYANLTTPKHYQEVTGADYSWKPGYAIPK